MTKTIKVEVSNYEFDIIMEAKERMHYEGSLDPGTLEMVGEILLQKTKLK